MGGQAGRGVQDRGAARVRSLIANDLGLSFDRTRTATTTALVIRLYDQANAALDRLDRQEHEHAEVSGGPLVQWTAADLPPRDVKALIQAADAAIDEAVRLEQVDQCDGTAEARSMLNGIMIGVRAAYTGQTAPGAPDSGFLSIGRTDKRGEPEGDSPGRTKSAEERPWPTSQFSKGEPTKRETGQSSCEQHNHSS